MSDIDQQIDDLVEQQLELRVRLAELYAKRPREPVEDYALTGPDGPVRLSELFGDRRDLLLIHNMGRSCPYCTLWADGFEGVRKHLERRAAVVLVSPDSPEDQAAFAEGRGWKLRMISHAGTTLSADLGFLVDGSQWPGVSALHRREDGGIERVSKAFFGPGDPFNPVWHLLDTLDGGVGDFQVRF